MVGFLWFVISLAAAKSFVADSDGCFWILPGGEFTNGASLEGIITLLGEFHLIWDLGK